jgi:hypothetical protein
MSSITPKRSAAALGVVAGLLAAAGPAGAQLPPTATGVTASGGWPDDSSENGALTAAKVTVPDIKVSVASFGGGLSREPF